MESPAIDLTIFIEFFIRGFQKLQNLNLAEPKSWILIGIIVLMILAYVKYLIWYFKKVKPKIKEEPKNRKKQALLIGMIFIGFGLSESGYITKIQMVIGWIIFALIIDFIFPRSKQ